MTDIDMSAKSQFPRAEPKTELQFHLETILSAALITRRAQWGHIAQSKRTQLKMEARSAHNFAAQVCQSLTKTILGLSGSDDQVCNGYLKGIDDTLKDDLLKI